MKAGETLKSGVFYELMSVLNDRKNNYKFDSVIEKYMLEDILIALKGNGFGVNAYPNSKSYNKYLDILPKISSKASTENKRHIVDKYNQELKTWNKLFRDFYSNDQFEEVTQVADENKFFAFLIAFEFYVRALNDLKFNGGKNKNFYGNMDIQRNINGQTIGIKELSANQFTDVIDLLFQQASKVVQAFIFYGYLYNNNEFKYCEHDRDIDLSDIKKSFNYFQLIDLRTVLFDLFEDWKFGNYEVLERDEKNVEIMPKSLKSFLDETIEAQRFESFRQHNIWSYDARNRDVKELSLTKVLAPESFLDKSEEASYNEYLEYFSSEKLDYKVEGIEIVKWLRAYAVVRHYNRKFLNTNLFPEHSIPDNWLYVSTVDKWVQLFTMHGIDEESAKIICDKFRFKKNSVDWFDSPFIEIGEKIITIPSVASRIQDVLALISMAAKEDMNLDFKGYCFEDRILNDLNTNKIPAVSIKRKIKGKEYQCDVAFILGKDLFLCECKHTVQPLTQRKRYDFYNQKIPGDIEQTNRICDFYSSNLNYIIDEFNNKHGSTYTSDWRPRQIYRMVIYSCKLASKLDIDGVIITDYTIFTTLLYKRLPTIFQNGRTTQFMPPKMKGVFQGKLTSNKLLNFLDNPWQMDFQKFATEIEDEVIPVNQIYLHKKKAFRIIDNFYA
ncbi:hypothetical protein [Ectobacillus panaciterrae]|uniref:hypothetical protein n=1 Tax=Ectobacillus panaciterrae TaxID=363872 RepID=UPI00048BDA74|nr:hypothetical protein [Ectobacillus panaciterrae]